VNLGGKAVLAVVKFEFEFAIEFELRFFRWSMSVYFLSLFGCQLSAWVNFDGRPLLFVVEVVIEVEIPSHSI